MRVCSKGKKLGSIRNRQRKVGVYSQRAEGVVVSGWKISKRKHQDEGKEGFDSGRSWGSDISWAPVQDVDPDQIEG